MNEHILIVDDQPEVLGVLSAAFRAKGYRVTAAVTAIEALRAAQADPPALAICDLQLSESDGMRLLAQLRGLIPQLPTILLTGVLFDPQVIEASMGSLVSSYLPKPSRLNRILDEAGRLLKS